MKNQTLTGTPQDVKNIMTVTEVVAVDSEREIAFITAYDKVIAPFFNAVTGLEYDSTLQAMYPKEIQQLLKVSKSLYRTRYEKLQEKGEKVISADQAKNAIKIITYSEKSIAVIGDSRAIKDKFLFEGKKIGTFNRYLTVDGAKTAGWIFQTKHKAHIESVVGEYLKASDPFADNAPNDKVNETVEPKNLF